MCLTFKMYHNVFQEQIPQAVNSFVLLVDKESSLRPERCPGIRVSFFILYHLYYNAAFKETPLFDFPYMWKEAKSSLISTFKATLAA